MIPLSGYAKAKKYVDSFSKLNEKELIKLKKKYPGPCVTISRQSGIDIQILCEKLIHTLKNYYPSNWAYFDKDLLRKVLEDHHLSLRLQKFLDEERLPKINQMLNELLGIHPPILELIHRMSKTILNLAEIGNVILIGRGSNVISSHLKNTLNIRLIAPLEYRIIELQRKNNMTRDWANKILLREDKNRKDFLYRTFKKNINDPTIYHTVINCSLFNLDELVEYIVDLVKIKNPHRKEMKENNSLSLKTFKN